MLSVLEWCDLQIGHTRAEARRHFRQITATFLTEIVSSAASDCSESFDKLEVEVASAIARSGEDIRFEMTVESTLRIFETILVQTSVSSGLQRSLGLLCFSSAAFGIWGAHRTPK